MRQYRQRIDPNQPAIVKALRARGASVQSLGSVGAGCPDLLVGFKGINLIMEVKDPDSDAPAGRNHPLKLNPAQVDWFETWNGSAKVVMSVEDAMNMLDVLERLSAMPGGPDAPLEGEEWKR